MSLLEDLFNFVSKKRSLTQKEQQSQAIKAFILEPILTPSGLVDDPTHGADAIIIDPNPAIDHSLDFPPDAHPGLDHAPDVDLHLPTEAILPEHIELLPFIHDPEPAIPGVEDLFNSGIFTVGASGKVSIDYLFDGGGYQGQLAIFNLKDMEGFDLNTETGLADFIHEAAHRALSNSNLGHVVIADATEGAKFSGLMPSEWENHNFGEYQGVKTFDMQAGDRFAVMLVPNGTVQQVLEGNQDADIRPLFSLHTVNPNEAFHAGQIADVTGDGNTFVLEDLRTDHTTDRDYNDIIFQVRGATGTAVHLDEVINPDLDWRSTDLGHALLDYAQPYVTSVDSVDVHLSLPEVPQSHQPLIGIIDTGLSADNPDIDYTHITLGHDYIDGDNNPLLQPGEGNEHGTHIAGIIGATQNNDIGIDGINDRAPLWVGRATGSGHWADSLTEFVDAAKASDQPNAVVNLSFDLTQINPDGSITTRYEFTPHEIEALEYARQNHVLIVAAAGNDGGIMSALGQASQEFDNIITVGAAERVNDEIALSNAFDRTDYSSYGSGLDIVASGGTAEHQELSTVGDGLGTMAGTSVATAKVTGAVSQIWAANPDLSYQQVIGILKNTATDLKDIGSDAETGAGLLNMLAAVELAKATVGEGNDNVQDFLQSVNWEVEGNFIPLERAVNFSSDPPFSVTVKSTTGINLRTSPSLNARSNFNISNGMRVTVDDWTYGDRAYDLTTGTADELWFRVTYNGQKYWIPSAYTAGYPPSSPPVLKPLSSPSTSINKPTSAPASISNQIGRGSRSPQLFADAYNRINGQGQGVTPNGDAYRWGNGWTQRFRDRNGNEMLLMLEDGQNKAYWVLGSNLSEYKTVNGANGALGYPRSDENVFSKNNLRAVWQAFAGSNGKARIHNLTGSSSVATWGSIGSLYTDMNGAYSWLGMPTRREYTDGDTVFSDFQGGRIAFNRNTGKTEALYWGQEPSWRLFDIKTVFDPNLRNSAYSVINDAISTWKSKIRRGPDGSPVKNGFTVRIYESNLSGYAGGSYAQNGYGEIDLTQSFFTLPYLQQKKVLLHELGHVMGFAESPEYKSKVQKINGAYYFVGANAKSLYGGNVPLQGNFNGTGEAYLHWKEGDSQLKYDLMSAETNEGFSDVNFKYTLAAFKDMGFDVI
jgi:hypothetical protein